ncbi:MAG: hypothetical protein JOS17DRAFT_685166 [Linnemannia elongata]|nr:MAG: hypothetical protein JOS17DRAFT_685166 [Linnemannia elongata]
MDKQRNNSISSNASSNSSSSTANKHPCKFPTCGWSFKRYEHLKRHMLVHTKERPFVCEFQGCEKSFSRSDNFSAHLRTHTKKSMHMRKFDRHLMMDSNNSFMPMSNPNNHCCPVPGCMKRFKRLEHLKRHTKTHTLERPFVCTNTGCNKRFSRSDNLCKFSFFAVCDMLIFIVQSNLC